MQQADGNSPLSGLERLFDELPEITCLSLQGQDWQGVSIDVLRLDKIHAFISGNKWYKLKQHLKAAQAAGKSRLLSFGGAYSNHLHALAFAGKELGVETIGVVRGECPETLTPTLEDCVNWGMTLEWLSRRDYRTLAPVIDGDHVYSERYPDAWVIPEGGSGLSGVEGVRELFSELHQKGKINHDIILTPVGTGTTLSGIAAAALPDVRCIGFCALKGAEDIEHDIERELARREVCGPWQVVHDYHFGGFAKLHPRLKGFISDFYDEQGILLDPVYTGKMCFGLLEMLRQKRIPTNARYLLVHTGGLQGWRGFGEMWPVIGNNK